MSECGGGQHGDTPVASELVGYNTIRGAAERSKKDTGERAHSCMSCCNVLFSFRRHHDTSQTDKSPLLCLAMAGGRCLVHPFIIIRQDADAYDLHRYHHDLAAVLYSPRFLFLAGVAFEFCVYS